MEHTENKAHTESFKTYLTIASIIEAIENRMKWSELIYIFMNLSVFAMVIISVAITTKETGQPVKPIHLNLIFSCLAIGICINTFWVASSMRLQLKLKLRYFQARYLERKLNRDGEYIFSDESLFFNPEIGEVKSPDGKETVLYPKEGILAMDGHIGSAKPRTLSLVMPLMFFIIYLISLLSIIGIIEL